MSTTTQISTPSEPSGPIQFEWDSEEQKYAVEFTPGRPLLLMGGFSSGKTSAAILHFLSLADAFPGYRVAVLRKISKDLHLTTRPSFDQWLDPRRVKDSSRDSIVLDNGSSFIFHHLDTPDSATVLKGLEINGALLDQAEQMQERVFTVLLGRLGRWRKATVPPWVIASRGGQPWPWVERGTGRPVPPIACVLTANPTEEGDPETHWLWQRFSPESDAWRNKWSKQGYRQISFDTRKSIHTSQQNLELLLDQDEDYIARFVRGEWVRSKGHLFHVDPQSVVEYDESIVNRVQNTTALGRVLDHGDTSPTCCLWYGVDEDHNLFFFQEYWQPGRTDDGREFLVADHRRAITEMSRKMTFRASLADPSIFDKSRNISGFVSRVKRWSVSDEYMNKDIIREDTAIRWTPADNNEDLSRQRLRAYLRPDPNHKNPITGEWGAPHIYFIMKDDRYWPHGCNHVVKDIRAARLEQVGENDGRPVYGTKRDEAIPDHGLDGCRYVVNAHAVAASPPRRPRETTAEMNDGRVIITLPAIKDMPVPREVRKRNWRSRGGGYVVLLCFLLNMWIVA